MPYSTVKCQNADIRAATAPKECVNCAISSLYCTRASKNSFDHFFFLGGGSCTAGDFPPPSSRGISLHIVTFQTLVQRERKEDLFIFCLLCGIFVLTPSFSFFFWVEIKGKRRDVEREKKKRRGGITISVHGQASLRRGFLLCPSDRKIATPPFPSQERKNHQMIYYFSLLHFIWLLTALRFSTLHAIPRISMQYFHPKNIENFVESLSSSLALRRNLPG